MSHLEKMASAVYYGARQIQVEERPKPTPPEGWALVKVSYSGICGTDLNIYVGAHPRARGPLVLGHELSGTLVEGHPSLKAGTPVTIRPLLFCGKCEPCQTGMSHVCKDLKLVGIDCDGAMAEYVVAPVETIHALPDGVSLRLGALIEPLAVGVHVVRQSEFTPGDTALVFGAGPIGMCVAVSLQLLGAGRVIVVETNRFRLQMAKEMGFETIDPEEGDVVEQILYKTEGNGADYSFDCAGHPSVSEILTQVTRVRGTVVIVAAYKKAAPIDLLQVMFKEITLKGARVYTPKDFDIAAELLKKPFDFEKLITHVLPIDDIQTGFDLLLSGGNAVKVLVEIGLEKNDKNYSTEAVSVDHV
ncbi:alcohol dehydrogenase catalytic domain-containing protein [Cytobacillus depressus]|uniref:Alcohol dehydrogenase catalytic domain-containing protein n=2 Tax=Cytobacillus depressus TaxID=1602942 RepID=A0A6L3UZB3_9BACI|nr:alcohol dehydrogenase catalytic domain-containing protein [Cytobacillus depressus]